AQLENRQRDLQQYAEQKQMELAEEQQVMINRVFYELTAFLESYNQEHGHALILTTSASTNNILIGNNDLDITKAVADGLNNQYAAQNKKK
ncbi:MAG: OmpH family outer membrane protein, partial [Bacteroidetes bacterium]|nr:OmpH family outer membrane protein [Bacteroidota bacterium]